MNDTAVVGGGVLGMAVAERLRQRGEDVTVFEASSQLGGLEHRWHVQGATWDRHCDVVSTTDARTRQLLSTLGLDRELRPAVGANALRAGPGEQMWPFGSPADLLRLPILTPAEKARLMATVLAAYVQQDSPALDQQSAQDWLTARCGRRAFDQLWRPLLRARLGESWPQASARYVVTVLQRRIVARPRRGWAGSINHLPGGRGRLVARYADALTDAGVKLELDAPVREVRSNRTGLEVVFDDTSAHFDKVVVTTSAPVAAEVCSGLRASERERLQAVRYVGVMCASVLISRSVSSMFVTYLIDPVAPFTQIAEMTNIVPPAELGGWHLLYLTRHMAADDEWFALDDATIRSRFLDYLERMYPVLLSAEVRAFRVSRIRRLFPLPAVGGASSVPDVVTSVPGLQLLGSANLRFATANLNDTLALLQELR